MSQTVDELVLRYLKMKGLDEAAKLVENNVKNNKDKDEKQNLYVSNGSNGSNGVNKSSSGSSSGSGSGEKFQKNDLFCFSEDIVIDGFGEGNVVNVLSQSYNSYRSWACSSLDFVKSELLMMCFPIFVYSYICMIRKGMNTEAVNFWNENIYLPPNLTLFYSNELFELSIVDNIEQFKDNEFLKAYRFISCLTKEKFVVKISRFGYNLMKSFVLQNDLLYLANIFNEKIVFETFDNENISEFKNMNIPSLILPGYSPVATINNNLNNKKRPKEDDLYSSNININNLNAQDRQLFLSTSNHQKTIFSSSTSENNLPMVDLFVPGKQPVIIESLESPVYRFQENDHFLNELLGKIVKPKLLFNKKRGLPDKNQQNQENYSNGSNGNKTSSSSNSSNNNSNSRIYLDNKWIEDPNLICGKSLQPSVFFSTMTNTYNEMICMNINSEISQVVAGFQNSVVRVFNLSNNLSEQNHNNKKSNGEKNKKNAAYNDLSFHVNHKFKQVFPKTQVDFISSSQEEADINDQYRLMPQQIQNGEIDDVLELIGHSKPVYGVSQNSSGKIVISGSSDETVRLWDVNLSQCVGKYSCETVVWGVDCNPAFDCYFATANQNSSLSIFATHKLNPLRLLLGHTSDVTCVSWSKNGVILSSGSDDKTCRVWDFRQGSCVRVLTGSNTGISCVCFSKDGRLLASGSESGSIIVHDIFTGKLLGLLQGHKNMVTSVSFSEDTESLVSGSLDGTVRVWNISQLLSQYSNVLNDSVLLSHEHRDENHQQQNGSEINHGKTHEKAIDSSTTVEKKLKVKENDYDANLNYMRMMPPNVNILSPYHVFHTKFTPVYFVNYSEYNLIYAGGPFSPDGII